MDIKIYASDEGFGHIVRQRAIIEELLKEGKHNITLQTQHNVHVAKEFFKDRIQYIEKFNNIITIKSSGSLDVQATNSIMEDYFSRFTKSLLEETKEIKKYDFVISDLVPEAIAAAKICNKKAFGVCHFTWDWTFDKIFGQKKFVKLLEAATHEAEAIFFPPFTPDEIIEKYSEIAVRVPFVVYPFSKIDLELPDDKTNVLVLDSGTNILSEIIEKNIPNFKKLKDYNFIRVNDSNKVHNLIPYADLVISRAGFNTISDCINAKTPMLLIEEKRNPEIEHNLSRVSELGLCIRMSVDDYAKNFVNKFERFMKEDYQEVLDTTKNHNFKSNGAEKIVKEIMRRCTQ